MKGGDGVSSSSGRKDEEQRGIETVRLFQKNEKKKKGRRGGHFLVGFRLLPKSTIFSGIGGRQADGTSKIWRKGEGKKKKGEVRCRGSLSLAPKGEESMPPWKNT